ncbi:ATP-binding cassette domain-containing protein [Evtepia sp.]
MEYALTTQGLTKTYAQTKALNGLTMHVPKGAIYGFVGKNGAGKTTLIRLVCGLQAPTAGDYTLYGVPHTVPEIYKARRRMGAVVETPSVYLDLTAADNLKLQHRLLGLPSEEGIPALLRLVGLEDTGKKKARYFSLGMRQRLGIAVALCGDPDFLILDEPINGLDPQGIIEMRELILRLNREHQITVLISSHILDELARLATHYGFLDRGAMVQEISAQALEAACRKCTRLTVTNPAALCQVLDRQGIEYRLVEEGVADVYGEGNLTQLILDLSQAGCQVTGIHQRDESLESYYMNLVGGEEP